MQGLAGSPSVEDDMTIYDELGVRTIINAKGPSTRLSGGFLDAEVARAMVEASQHCVDMAELQAAASRVIADTTNAEAGYVTSGAAAGLLLGTAACVTGLDPGKMNRLPDTTGMKNEAVMVRSQRNFYDHAIRGAGVRIVEVGLPDRFAGAGVRDAEGWEIDQAIGERTALVFYVASAGARPPLAEVVKIAHARGVPVLVDAAGQLPPADNLRRFVALGADLVAFSGGKAIGGPQASGFLAGRRELVAAVALQNLDLDFPWELWRPPSDLIDKSLLPGAPHHGIGRPCKVGKEEIVGLVVALRRFAAADPEARRGRWLALARTLAAQLDGIPGTSARVVAERPWREIPQVELALGPEARGTALALMQALETGSPPVFADPARLDEQVVVFGTSCLREGDPFVIATRIRDFLGDR
jgi:D-glucosaminate-6-phosphate ammonia-lyase